MEIPYIVEPRKDTGLNNSKIGIWLFLASEVMLFGGLFSGYVFLRIFADYPWPERTLPILPGLINTFVLIGSSVTVVFAWVSLKLRQWRKFQVYMSITIVCAAAFMVLKGFEYKAKFEHQAMRLTDYTVLEGHAHPQKDPNHADQEGHDHAKDEGHGGHATGPKKNYNLQASSITFTLNRPDKEYFETLAPQYEAGEFTLAKDVVFRAGKGSLEVKFAKGEPLTWEILVKAREQFKAVAANNSNIGIKIREDVWKQARKDYPSKQYYEIVDGGKTLKEITENRVKDAKAEHTDFVAIPVTTLTFAPKGGKALLSVSPDMGKLSDAKTGATSTLSMKDLTVANGVTADSSMILAVDAIDFRHTVMKAEEKGITAAAAIEKSWVLQENPNMKNLWAIHEVMVAKLEKHLEHKGHEPTETERYRMGWKEIAAVVKNELTLEQVKEMSYEDFKALEPSMVEGFTGANHKATHFPEVTVPREHIRFESVFSPRWNTYYATYFTITGLHGLHVIAGALVLLYYLVCGRKMYNENPEWLANRVEVGGLFWHFVDLVWIFLFPILYLM